MGAINTPAANVVSLLDAYNQIGRRESGDNWTGTEAAAIRLGQRSKADPDALARGLIALRTMRHCAENGWLRLIYTSHDRRRVSYFDGGDYWLSAIFPDPVGTGEGMIELDDRHLQPCVADISALKRWPSMRSAKVKTGPKCKFSVFKEKVAEFFRTHPTTASNLDVRTFVKAAMKAADPWPEKSRANDLIGQARDHQRALDLATVNSGQTAAGRL